MLCKSDRVRAVVGIVLALGMLASAMSMAAPTAANLGAATPPAAAAKLVFAPDLPLKRDAGNEGVGTGTAALVAGVILVAGVWAAMQVRRRQRGVVRKPGAVPLSWFGRFLPDSSGRQLRVLETATLTSHARLHVVVWQGQEYLVATALDKVSILDRRESPALNSAIDDEGTA